MRRDHELEATIVEKYAAVEVRIPVHSDHAFHGKVITDLYGRLPDGKGRSSV